MKVETPPTWSQSRNITWAAHGQLHEKSAGFGSRMHLISASKPPNVSLLRVPTSRPDGRTAPQDHNGSEGSSRTPARFQNSVRAAGPYRMGDVFINTFVSNSMHCGSQEGVTPTYALPAANRHFEDLGRNSRKFRHLQTSPAASYPGPRPDRRYGRCSVHSG